MNYYQFHIGDYRRDTRHLSLVEHGIYRQLLDQYYLGEEPLPADNAKLMRSLCVRNATDERSLCNVLADFFELTPEGYIHKRCDLEIDAFHNKSTKARESANARWERIRCERIAEALRMDSDGNANHKPINHNNSSSEKKSSDGQVKKFKGTEEDLSLSKKIFSAVLVVNPTAKEPNWNAWANSIRLMREQDRRTPAQIWAVFEWANKDGFWAANVQCPAKIREKFDTISARMNSKGKDQAKPKLIMAANGKQYEF